MWDIRSNLLVRVYVCLNFVLFHGLRFLQAYSVLMKEYQRLSKLSLARLGKVQALIGFHSSRTKDKPSSASYTATVAEVRRLMVFFSV